MMSGMLGELLFCHSMSFHWEREYEVLFIAMQILFVKMVLELDCYSAEPVFHCNKFNEIFFPIFYDNMIENNNNWIIIF